MGAGISNDPPANLPLAADLTTGVINVLCESNDKLYKKRRHISERLSTLRPEVLLQTLYDSLGQSALDVLDILRGGVPNQNHCFLAEIAKQGLIRIVITTNFDSLIERALEQEACDFFQVSTEQEFANWKRLSKNITVNKLHGTLNGVGGQDKKSTIQATLAQVGQPFGKSKSQFLKHILSNYDVVFLGYSGLDDFDISPLLASIKTKRTIYWVEHTGEGNVNVLTSKEIEKLPISERSNSDKIISNRGSGYKIRCNTAIFISELRSYLKYPPPKYPNNKKRKAYQGWFRSWAISSELKKRAFFTVGRLMGQQREWREAITYYREATKQYSDIDKSRIFRNLGVAYGRLSEFSDAIKYYELSLRKHREDDCEFRAGALINLGWVYYQQGDYTKAIDTFEQSVSLLKGERKTKAAALNNLGVAYYRQRNWDEALRCFDKSLSIKTELGDIYGIAATVDNIGLVYTAKKDWANADKYHHKSLNLYKSLGDPFGEAQTLDSIGELYLEQGDIKRGIEHLQKSLELKQRLGDPQVEGITLVSLGRAYSKIGDLTKALQLFSEALKLAEKVGAKRELAISYQNIGKILKDKGEHYLRLSIEYFEKLGMANEKQESEQLLTSSQDASNDSFNRTRN